jgi:hypothetical protein
MNVTAENPEAASRWSEWLLRRNRRGSERITFVPNAAAVEAAP